MTFNRAFISYGRADSKNFATKLYNFLNKKGFKIWFDQNDIPLAVDFQAQINDGIAKAENFIFIIAPHSVNSPYCLKEIELAIKFHKRIIPLIHVEQITRETWQERNPGKSDRAWETYQTKGLHSSFPNMHPEIGKINWVPFQENTVDFQESLEKLIQTFHKHENYVHQHTQILDRALEWESHQKQTRYLLTGEERKSAEDWLKIRFKQEQPPCTPSDLHCEFITESIKNANNLMTQVFLSYSQADVEVMQQVRNLLRREGLTVWTSQTDVQTGEDFGSAINRGIEQADNLVYLLSPDSQKSEYCRMEFDYAFSLNKRIIPILVRPTPESDIPPELAALQYLELTDNLESDLLKILRQDAAYYEEHKILLAKAIKWERQHNNPSILLRGYNLRSAEAWWKVAKQRDKHLPTALQEKFLTASLQQPPLSSLDVFISYSRADSDFARKLNDSLQLQGKTTWFDQESIATGTNFQTEIYRGIASCDNFLFILSSRSVSSPFCADEVEYAAKLNKRFVTVLYQRVNSENLHPELAKVQWIDFNQTDGDFNPNFNQLVRTLDTDREYVHSHTKWSCRSLEWEAKGKSQDMLLRGSEFAIASDWWQQAKQENKQPPVTKLQSEFITKSREAIEAGEKQEKRRNLMLRSLLVGVSIALVAAVGLGITAFSLYRRSEHQTKEAKKLANIANLRADAYELEKLMDLKPVESLVRAIASLGKSKDRSELQHLLHLVKSNLHRAGGLVQERNLFLGHENGVNSVAISPDGQIIVSASWDNTVRLWDLNGNPIGKPFFGHQFGVNSVAFSPDGQTIVSGSNDETVRLWDLNGNPIGKPLTGHEDGVNSVAFSPDGQTIVSASYDETVRLWDLNGNPIDKPLTGHEHGVKSVAFSPDGQTIVSASYDKTLRLWDRDGNPIGEPFVGHEDGVISVAFSPNGQMIVSGSYDETVRLWDLNGNPIGEPLTDREGNVSSVAFSPDGQTIISVSEDTSIRLWDLEGNAIAPTLNGHSAGITSIAISPDGQTIVSGSDDQTVRLWDVPGNAIALSLKGHQESVRSVAISPDGQTIVSGSADKTLRLWDLEGNARGEPFIGHQETVRSVAFSPDGQTIVSGSYDKTLRLWDLQGNQIGEPFTDSQDLVLDVAFSPDGQTIVSGNFDHKVRLWDLQGNVLGEPFIGHKSWVVSVGFSPDGQSIISGSSEIRFWDLEGNAQGEPLTGYNQWFNSVGFSPDGQSIISGNGDKTFRLWDLEGNERGKPFVGHQDAVTSVAISPDGQTIVSGSRDKTLRLWDLQGNQIGEPLTGHQDRVNSVAFSPDGQTIVSGSDDKTVRLWHGVTWQTWLRQGCDRLQWHPAFIHPEPEFAEISQGAVETCIEDGGWSDGEIAQFRVQQGRTLARLDGNLAAAREKFKEAEKFDANLDLPALITSATEFAAWAKVKQGKDLAEEQKIPEAVVAYQAAQELVPEIDLNPKTEEVDRDPEILAQHLATRAAADAKLSAGSNLAQAGNIPEAIAAYNEAQTIDPTLEIEAGYWFNLCWHGSLYGQAATVMEFCEKAIVLEPEDAEVKVGRGLARALTEDKEGAIADLSLYIKELGDDDEWKSKVQGWIDTLKTGENPFTEEVLQELR